jgi:dihydroorotate dehydrogenase
MIHASGVDNECIYLKALLELGFSAVETANGLAL